MTRGAQGVRAVVLGIEHPRGVAVMRSLGREGIPIVAVERNPTARGLRSRYLSRAVVVDGSPAATVSTLESLGREGGGFLIPTNDHFVMIVSQHFERLAHLYSISVPPWDVLGPIMDTSECYRLGSEAGLRTPRFFAPRDAADVGRIVSALDFTATRYLVRMRLASAPPADPRHGRMTKAAGDNADDLRAACLDIVARTGEFPMIVEVVPGRSDRCVGVSMVVGRDLVPVVAYCVRRLQLHLYARNDGFIHPYDLGASVYCESVRDDEAIEAATRFVRHAGLYGTMTVEFRRDSRDGGLTLIKVDPRMVRATSLSMALGLDVPRSLYRAFTGGRPEPPRSYREGVGWMWVTWYLETLWLNRGHTPIARELFSLLRRAYRIRAFAYLSARDPLPALVDAFRATGHWVCSAARATLPRDSILRRIGRAAKRRLYSTG